MMSLVASVLCFTVLLAWLNERLLRLPLTVGLMGLSLGVSLLLVAADHLGFGLRAPAAALVSRLHFRHALLDGMLSFLLFAGALHVDLGALREQKLTVAVLALVGTVLSTLLLGGLSFLLFAALGLHVPLPVCLLFGALVSPTDPIAVLAMLKDARAPVALFTQVAGEALFNDGVGIVLFVTLSDLVGGDTGTGGLHPGPVAVLLLREVGGGLGLGVLLGGACFALLRSVRNEKVELLLTLALAAGSWELAHRLGVSGPLAVVAAGILIGNLGREHAMSHRGREVLDTFWELIDEILNALLFAMIGLELLVLELKPLFLLAATLVVPLALLARLISLALPAVVLRAAGAGRLPLGLFCWGGLRGGISVALALSLPDGPFRELLLVATYGIVGFSVLVQAPTVPPLIGRTLRREA
ncbi:cation:proton antiporter [Rhizosaccharibacter radicis]|uniref:Cation:proton antiporter n=1 Tax=Rhizosaccharibacter radicis TaxID=2782605 RepID=A0ABT1VTR7_9PROT|nr:cation:proton antiporter [Acetobacteraceae bacterium KSS12]